MVEERSLAPEVSLVDIRDRLLWHKTGEVSLVYEISAFHEPGMNDDDFNQAAFVAENAWGQLSEETRYQYFVLVDHKKALKRLDRAMPPIPDSGATSRLLEEFRRARLDEFTRAELQIQERRHYLVATMRPKALKPRSFIEWLSAPLRKLFGGRGNREKFESAYEAVLAETAILDRRIFRALTTQQGLESRRCGNDEMTRLAFELLNPTASEVMDVAPLHEDGGDGVPKALFEEMPNATEAPIWSLLNDDLMVRREYLRLGDRYMTVISLKKMPDRTEPGMLVPMLKLPRDKYRLVFTVEIPRQNSIVAGLTRREAQADGLRHATIVKSDRVDVLADAVSKQSNEAMRKLIGTTQRILDLSLQIVLMENSPEALEEAVQDTLSELSSAHGLTGYRETYNLQPAFLSVLPGAPALKERVRSALSPNMVDMLPCFDFKNGDKGKIVLTTPNASVVYYDPFDAKQQHNANILIVGASGSGKSVAAQVLLTSYEIANAAQSEPSPFVFVIDNGGSYKRMMDLRDDGRYVRFSFEEPPGIDVFAYDDDEDRDEHVSRLEWLLLDLLRVSPSDEEEFDRKKALIEAALYALYPQSGGSTYERSFSGFAEALKAVSEGSARGVDMAEGLFPFTQGKFAGLLAPNSNLELTEDVHAVCYDFEGLAEHPDLSLIALRLVIYQVRRFAARMKRERNHRSFLVLDESWALLDSSTSGAVSAAAAPFIAASVRMGRKEGLSTIGLSQQIEDFAASAYGAAIVGNSATKLVGKPGRESIDALQQILKLSDRQVDQLRRLGGDDRGREFLLIQGDQTNVVRIPLEPFSRWCFTTDRRDRDRHAALKRSRPDLDLLERIRLLAKEAA